MPRQRTRRKPGKKFFLELDQVAGLKKIVENANLDELEIYTYMELVLHGLAEFEVLSKEFIETKWVFKDFLAGNLKDDDVDMRDLFN